MTNLAKLLLFVALALIGLSLSFLFVEKGKLHYTVIYLTYPNLFIIFGLWGIGMFHALKTDSAIRQLLKIRWWEIGLILLAGYFILLFEKAGFKIIFDELILSTTAQMMHSDKLAGMPQMGNDLQGSYILLDSILDKRPLVFPFILSAVHDLIGYRYWNVFILNGILSFVLLYLVYTFTRTISGRKAAILALVLLVNLPLLSIFANSGHFEVLNLVGLTATLFWGYVYIRKPSNETLVPLVLTLTILSQIRYENTLYLLPFGILILAGWKKRGGILLPWQVVITPLFYVLYAMHYRLIFGRSDTFQEGPNGREATFSTDYIADNLTSAVEYLFSISKDSSNSPLVSILGVTAVFFFCAYAFRRANFLSGRDPKGTIMFYGLMAAFLFSIVISLFNFGLFNIYITNRLSLPIYLLFVLIVPFILKRYGRNFILGVLFFTLLSGVAAVFFMDPGALVSKGVQYGTGILAATALLFWVWKRWRSPTLGLTTLGLIYLLAITMPVAHPSRYTQQYKPALPIQYEMEFLKKIPFGEKYLWVTSAPYVALLQNVSCLNLRTIKDDPEIVARHLRDRNYTKVFIPRIWRLNEEGELELLHENETLDTETFELRTFQEYPIYRGLLYRIDELVKVHEPDSASEKDPDNAPPETSLIDERF